MQITPPAGRTVHKGRRIEIRVVDRPVPGGGTRQSDLVVHPGAVVVLAIDGDGQAVLVRNRRYALDGWLLELPAGTLEPPGEDPRACAERELREETGFRARAWEPLGRFWSAPGYCTEVLHAFLARDLEPVGQDLDEGEEIEVVRMPLADLFRQAEGGGIEDAKTLATLLLARSRLQGHGSHGGGS